MDDFDHPNLVKSIKNPLKNRLREIPAVWAYNPIVNYGNRYRHGERISTGFVESAVNQIISKRFVKKQQMRWSKRGAHSLLQVRTKVLDGDWRTKLSQWYPGIAEAA